MYVIDSHGASTTPGRIVRFDDLTGAGWTTFDLGGPSLHGACAAALDAEQRLYFGVSDPVGLVRIDNMSGAGLAAAPRKAEVCPVRRLRGGGSRDPRRPSSGPRRDGDASSWWTRRERQDVLAPSLDTRD